jgi:hypothetical protein
MKINNKNSKKKKTNIVKENPDKAMKMKNEKKEII